jgi:hypothetical protein
MSHRLSGPVLILAAVHLFAFGLNIGGYGYYSDDWWFGDRFYWNRATTDSDIPSYHFFRNHAVREFRCLEIGLKTGLIRILGLKTAYLFQILTGYAVSILFFIIIRRRQSSLTAWLLTLFFTLAPLDTTQLWLSTLHWRIAMLLVLTSIMCAGTRYRWFSPLILLTSMLFQEGTAPLYLMALLWLPETDRGNKQRFILVGFAAACALYGLWRFALLPILTPDHRVLILLEQPGRAILSRFLWNYAIGAWIVFISGFTFVWDSIVRQPVLSGCIAMLTLFLTATALIWLARAGHDRHPARLPPISWTAKNLCLSFVLSYWTGVFMFAGHEMGPATRMNYPAHITFAFLILLLLTFIQWFAHGTRCSSSVQKYIILLTSASLLSLLTTHTLRIQTDYKDAWNEQIEILSQLVPVTTMLPPGNLIILDVGSRPPGAIDSFPVPGNWHRESLTRNFMNPGIRLLLKQDILHARILDSGCIRLNTRSHQLTVPHHWIHVFRWTGTDLVPDPSIPNCLILNE